MVAQEAHQIRPLAFDNSLGRKLGEFCAVLLSEVGLLRNAVNVEPQRETSLKQLVHLGLEVDVVSALLQHRVRELEEWLRGQPKIGLGIRHHDLRRTLQLLMFTRKNVMQPSVIDLREIVGNMNKMLGRLLGETIVLEFHAPEKLPTIYGDSGMIEQVLMNLAVNAHDA